MPMAQVYQLREGQDVHEFLIERGTLDNKDAVAALDLAQLRVMYQLWQEELPGVRPHYAVKCNPHTAVVQTLQDLGCGFDCASPPEIRLALSCGAKPADLIYANPNKQEFNIREAFGLGVDCFTYDSEGELYKLIRNTPEGQKCKLVLRLLPPDESASVCRFGVKFGASREEARRILKLTIQEVEKGTVELLGLSFHVGSGCFSAASFTQAVLLCGEVAAELKAAGHPLRLLDLGGGFMTVAQAEHYREHGAPDGGSGSLLTFREAAAALREALGRVRPAFAEDLRVVAEPGRFFAGDCATLAVRVFGRRLIFDYAGVSEPEKLPLHEAELAEQLPIAEAKYYVGDGVYGWFNSIFYDHVTPALGFYGPDARRLRGRSECPSNIFGPTCDSLDCILRDKTVPLLEPGDWIVCKAFGAYTQAAATEFNGFPHVQTYILVE